MGSKKIIDTPLKKIVEINLPDHYTNEWLIEVVCQFDEINVEVKFVGKTTTTYNTYGLPLSRSNNTGPR